MTAIKLNELAEMNYRARLIGNPRDIEAEDLEHFRRSLIDELADPRGFDPPALAQRIEAFAKAAGKESVDQRGRARLGG